VSIDIKGTVVEIGETQTLGSKGFQKRAFVVKTDEKYPQELEIEATKERIDALDGIRVGDPISVSVNIKGRRWEGPKGVKFYVSLEAWKIETSGDRRGAPTSPKPVIDVVANSSNNDDIPFATCQLEHEPTAIASILREGC
jgi:hypothetical protein